MTKDELDKLVGEIGISRNQILREEAEMTFLDQLAQSALGSKVLFYGGTALRLVYNSPRFSEDIDLLRLKKINFSEFEDFIKKVVEHNANWKLDDIKDKRQTIFAVFLIKDDKLKHNFSLKIEIHKPARRVKIKYELMLIKSPTTVLNPLLLVPLLSELKKLKEISFTQRRKARDVFDLWYIFHSLRENFDLPKRKLECSEREFKNELQVFLPRKYYPIISQLYDKINRKN